MLLSIIYSFVHGAKTYTLYTFSKPEHYTARIVCYDSEADVYFVSDIDSDLFLNKTAVYIDQHIVDWYDKSEKKPSSSID